MTDEKILHVTDMSMLKCKRGVTKMVRIRNMYIRERLKEAPNIDNLRVLIAYDGHVMRREESHVTRRVRGINVEGYKEGIGQGKVTIRRGRM